MLCFVCINVVFICLYAFRNICMYVYMCARTYFGFGDISPSYLAAVARLFFLLSGHYYPERVELKE